MSALRTRRAAVAGLFYPGRAEELTTMVDRLLAATRPATGAEPLPIATDPPVAVVVPHAGYAYSGRVAAAVYRRLAPYRGVIERAVLIGPAHRVRVDGLATVGVDALDTPLGPVIVDDELRQRALAHRAVHVDDRAHAEEHCLEVQLPFLMRSLGPVSILPLVVGQATPSTVAEVLTDLWGRSGVLVVVSTDLSHFHDDATAKRLDARTAGAIVAGDGDSIQWDDACGATPLRGALLLAGRLGQHAALVDLCTSADTAGEPERVVGYGGFEIR
jgi:hypothetical protein